MLLRKEYQGVVFGLGDCKGKYLHTCCVVLELQKRSILVYWVLGCCGMLTKGSSERGMLLL